MLDTSGLSIDAIEDALFAQVYSGAVKHEELLERGYVTFSELLVALDHYKSEHYEPAPGRWASEYTSNATMQSHCHSAMYLSARGTTFSLTL
jgi:U3 small nucleolar ribonucleoprotein component